MNRLKTLLIIAGILVTTFTFGQPTNDRITTEKNTIERPDSLKQKTESVPVDQDSTVVSEGIYNSLPSNLRSSELGIGASTTGGLSINFTAWKLINSYFSFGLGVGIRTYPQYAVSMVPVFVDLKVNMIYPRTVTPFLYLKGGYSLNGRFFFNPGFGINFRINQKYAIIAGVGYEYYEIGTSDYHRGSDSSFGGNIAFQF